MELTGSNPKHQLHSNTIQAINDFLVGNKCYYEKEWATLIELEKDEDQRKFLRLLADVESYALEAGNTEVPFSPMRILANGSRSASIEDLTKDDLSILRSIEVSMLPIALRARIVDVLWVKEKNYTSACNAVEHYVELFHDTFDSKKWTTCANFIKRANIIALQLGKKNQSFSSVCMAIDTKIIELSGSDPLFLSLILIELQIENDFGDFSQYIDFVDSIIDDEINSHQNNIRLDNAFQVKERLLKKEQRHDEILGHYLRLATFHENHAEALLSEDNIENLPVAIRHYERAMVIYRKQQCKEKAEDVQKKLAPMKKKYIETMPMISSSFDITEQVNRIKKMLEDCDFKATLLHLAGTTPICKKNDVKKEVISCSGRFLSQMFFAKEMLDKDGEKTVILPPLDIQNPENDIELLENHLHFKMKESQAIYGVLLSVYFEHLKLNTEFTINDLDFIVNENAIITQDRKEIIKFGLFLGLSGNYYAALHILVPQLENIFREIAQECGDIITTYDDIDLTAQSKTLGSVFELPKLLECYDENILFTFKGLLIEKCGSNLRNQIAHGILDSDIGSSSIAVYFLCLCVKIFTFCSYDSYSMFADYMKERKHQEPMAEDPQPSIEQD
ncbi:MAG: DUF4209 domain-containing protein [Oscillospiraceae bacterium]|nr:DUF4209 domain-containing protein [Oscillospiraceae bacterium]